MFVTRLHRRREKKKPKRRANNELTWDGAARVFLNGGKDPTSYTWLRRPIVGHETQQSIKEHYYFIVQQTNFSSTLSCVQNYEFRRCKFNLYRVIFSFCIWAVQNDFIHEKEYKPVVYRHGGTRQVTYFWTIAGPVTLWQFQDLSLSRSLVRFSVVLFSAHPFVSR